MLFNQFSRRQWMWCVLAFVAGIGLSTATLTFAQESPPGPECSGCFVCLDEFTRCAEKRDNIKQGVAFGLGIAVVGVGVGIGSGGTAAAVGSGLAIFGLAWAGTAYVHLLLTKCEPCNSACSGCSLPTGGGYGG